jgi:hypothetical protein
MKVHIKHTQKIDRATALTFITTSYRVQEAVKVFILAVLLENRRLISSQRSVTCLFFILPFSLV